jgi:WD40 repeat protein
MKPCRALGHRRNNVFSVIANLKNNFDVSQKALYYSGSNSVCEWENRMKPRFQRSWPAFLFTGLVTPLFAASPDSQQLRLALQTPPAASVNSVAVSPDGSLIASAAGEGGVRLYDAQTGSLLRTGESGDRCVVFSPDGRLLTAAGFHMDKLVKIYDVKSGRQVLALEGQTEWEADATAFSPDGKLLASTATDKQILVWDLATGKLKHQFQDQAYRSAALAFSPDSELLASGGGDQQVHLWDMTSGKLNRSLSGHRDWISAIAFSPDGQSIASASCDWGFHRGHDWPRPPARGREESEWKLWDVKTGKELRTVTVEGQMLSLAFAPNGKAVIATVDSEARLYDLLSQKPGRLIASHNSTITSVAFLPDGSGLVTASHDQTTKLTNVATGQTIWQAPGYFEQVNSVAISDDGNLLITGSGDHRWTRGKLQATAPELGPGAIRLWDARSGRMLRRLGDPSEQIMAVAISPDARQVAGCGATASGEGIVHVWDTISGTLLWTRHSKAIETFAVAFDRNGKNLAAGAANGEVTIYDATSGAVSQTLTGNAGGATSLAFSPDGAILYCGAGYGDTTAWDWKTGKTVRTFAAANSQARAHTINRLMHSIGLSRDGSMLATCNSDINSEFVDPVRLWDSRWGSLQRNFTAENIHGRPMALSPDGSLIATGGKSVKLWDARSGKLVRDLMGHLKRTQSIVFSADGRLLISGGSYGTTNIWEVNSGRHLATLFTFVDNRDGHLTDHWLAYTPAGHYDGSPGAEKYFAWRVGDEFRAAATFASELHRPDLIKSALTTDASR